MPGFAAARAGLGRPVAVAGRRRARPRSKRRRAPPSTGSAQRGRHGHALSRYAALLRQLARLPPRGGEFRVPGLSDHPRELRIVQRRVRPIGDRDMANWVLKGLRTGIRTTAYPDRPERATGVSPGPVRPAHCVRCPTGGRALVERCPTGAITRRDGGVAVDQGRCVHCFRCRRDDGASVAWDAGFEWAAYRDNGAARAQRLQRSFWPLAAYPLCRCRRLRRLHERGAAAQQPLLQHAPARFLHDADAAQRRRAAGCGPVSRTRCGCPCARPMRRCRRRSAWWPSAPARSPAACSARALPPPAALPRSSRSTSIVPGCPPPPLAILHALLLVVERKPPAHALAAASNRGAGMTRRRRAPSAFFLLCAPAGSSRR